MNIATRNLQLMTLQENDGLMDSILKARARASEEKRTVRAGFYVKITVPF
jgi:hypothetical protein